MHPFLCWRALLIVTFLQSFASLGHMSYAPLGEVLQRDLGLSNTQLGSLPTAAFSGTMVSTLLAGWLIDRLGVRPMTLLGPVLMALALLAVGWGGAFWMLWLLLFVLGVGNGAMSPLTSKAIADWFPPRSRGLAMSVKQSGVSLGVAVGAVVLPLIARAFGWQAAFQAAGLLLALVTMASYLLYQDPPGAAAYRQSRGASPGLFLAFRQPHLISLVLMGFVYCAFQTTIQTFYVPHLVQNIGLSSVAAGGHLALLQIAGMVGRPLLGVISDRLERRLEVLVALGLMSAASGAALKLMPDPSPLVLTTLTVFLGISVFGWPGLQFTMMTELVEPYLAARITALATMFNVAGAAAGPIAFGWLVDQTGAYGLALDVFTVSILLTALLLGLVPRWFGAEIRGDRPVATK